MHIRGETRYRWSIQQTDMNFLLVIMLFYFETDINECSEKNGGCDHTCENIDAGYNCSCDAGYTLADNQMQCLGELI